MTGDPSAISGRAPRVSVVVPVFNGEATIGECIASLERQTLPAEDVEVVVVDDASTDGTVQIVERAAARASNIRLVRRAQNGGPAAARNEGLRATRAPVVAFTDADCEADEAWLSRALSILDAKPMLAAIEGRTDVKGKPSATTHQMRNQTGGLWMTCNMIYRRQALDRAGGFDERFRLAFLEDSDVAFSVLEGGGEIAFAPEVVVRHLVIEEGTRRFWKDARKRFYNPLLYRKHPRSYVRHLRPIVPGLPGIHVRYMAAVVALVVTIALRWWVGAAPLLLVVAFLARRLTHAYRARDLGTIARVLVVPFVQTYWVLLGAVRFRAFSTRI